MSARPAARPDRRRSLDWWIAVLFMVGAGLFALGAVPYYSEVVGLRATALTFFVGSVFFTSAALMQYRQAVDALPGPRRATARHYWAWAPRDAAWSACAVQLAGTLWFNWSTANAVRLNLGAAEADQRVWRPDALGSIAFLVASAIAWRQSRHPLGGVPATSRERRIADANLLGSVAFGVSAVAAYVIPATGDVWNAEVSNLGTLFGALCFLVGAALLLPPGHGRGTTRPAFTPSGR